MTEGYGYTISVDVWFTPENPWTGDKVDALMDAIDTTIKAEGFGVEGMAGYPTDERRGWENK